MDEIEKIKSEIKNVNSELANVEKQIAKLRTLQRELNEKKTALENSINKLKSDSLASVDWSGTSYQWSKTVKDLLKDVFKLDSFRSKQLSAINSTLSGQHAIVVMPTGAGKSLCYQLPALISPGLTVVISPLISLMEDQIRSLTGKNISAKLMVSTSSKEESNAALNVLKDKNSTVKLLYVTPERLAKSKRFMSNLQKCFADNRLQRFAIDEVHCCSQWGHDFRPDYKYLGILANMFPKVPILGLTATATAHVLADVQKILNIPGCLVIKSTFNRPNLFYKILEKPSSKEDCLGILENLLKYRYKNESGIIYTHNINDAEDLSSGLCKRGLKVGCYHANLESNIRSKVHTKWHNKEYQAIVATVAFGMGIDKPDVRYVIHHAISKSMESYYQESGRAGRDGLRAECVTLYRMQDLFKVSTMVFSSVGSLDRLYGMVKYCLNGSLCRRQLIAEHFDEDWGTTNCNKMCDVCSEGNLSVKEINLEKHCEIIAQVIDNAEKQDVKVTAQKLIDAWYLKGPVSLRSKCKEPTFSRLVGEDVIAYLLVEGYLVEDFHFTAYSTISYIKNGPNMEFIKDPSFTLKMPVRKYYPFDLNVKVPTDSEEPIVTKTDSQEKSTEKVIEKNNKRKKLKEYEKPPSKRSKAIVIDDDDD